MEEYQDKQWGVTKIKTLKVSYKWSIYNFSVSGKQHGECIISPSFSSLTNSDFKWHIQLYPAGCGREDLEDRDWISIFVKPLLFTRPVQMRIEFCIVNNENDCSFKQETSHFFKEDDDECSGSEDNEEEGYGFYEFIERAILFDKANKYLNDDKLTIICNITVGLGTQNFESDYVMDHEDIRYQLKICNDLEILLEKQQFTDITLIADNKELYAHKAILAARSPIFSAMFSVDMKEKQENKVVFNDVDFNVLAEMLQYIYTGKIKNIGQYSYDLLILADKYCLNELKDVCEKFLCSTLSIENVVKLLVLADHRSCKKLKDEATYFITAYKEDVITTPEFKKLKDSHPHIVIDLLLAMIMKQHL